MMVSWREQFLGKKNHGRRPNVAISYMRYRQPQGPLRTCWSLEAGRYPDLLIIILRIWEKIDRVRRQIFHAH
jgi:hypothetical protein